MKKVFLSHTSEFASFPTGGRTFVNAALAAIRQAGFLGDDMGDFTSTPDSPAEVCIRKVIACDICVVLAGFRYGSPVRDRPEVSYVQLEYEAAVEGNVIPLVFLLDENTSGLPPVAIVDSEYGSRQAEFREKLLNTDMVCKTFASPDELHRVLYQALENVKSPEPASTVKAEPAPPVRRPLQHRQYLAIRFTGRENELSELENAIRQSHETGTAFGFWGLRGLGGIGKSALAAELADRLSKDEHFLPGGVLWTNLLEEDPEEAAGRWLRSYDQKTDGQTPSEWIERFHQLASERKPLVVLDNAQSAIQVQKLLVRRSGVINLVTTREQQNLPPDIESRVVAKLSPDDALSLLSVFARSHVEAEPDSAILICRQCGFLPVFLRVAGSAIKTGQYMNLQDYARELVERGLSGLADHDEQAAKVFELSWEKLDEVEKEVFSIASQFPGADIGVNFVQTWLKTETRVARRILTRLENSSLLLKTDNRFRFHDRVREFAAEKLTISREELVAKLVRCWTEWEMVESELNEKGAFELSREYFQLGRLGKTTVDEFTPWYHFIRGCTHILAAFPDLFFQQACNEPHDSPVSKAARNRIASGQAPDVWLERIHRPQQFAPPVCLQALTGHDHFVYDVACHPDGKHVISGSADNTVRMWDLQTGRFVFQLKGHDDIVSSVIVCKGGKHAVSGSHDHTLRIWNLGRQICEFVLEGHTDRVNDIAICYETRLIVSASHDETIRIWDLDKRKCVGVLRGHGKWVTAVDIDPTGRWIVSGSWDRTIKVWDMSLGTCVSTLSGHTSGVESIAIRHDGNLAVSGSRDATIRVWDLKTGRAMATLNGHRRGVRSIAICNDGCRVISGSWDKTLRMWNIESARPIAVFDGHAQRVEGVSLSHDNHYAFSCARDKTIREWDLETDVYKEAVETGGHTMRVGCVAMSPSGKLAISGSDDCTIRSWNVETGKSTGALTGHTRGVTSVALTRNATMVASGSRDQTIRIWQLENGECVSDLMTSGTVSCLDFVGDDSIVCGTLDSALQLWNFKSKHMIAVFEGHQDAVTGVTVNDDFSRAVSTSRDGTVKLWDLKSKRCLETFPAESSEATRIQNAAAPFRSELLSSGFRIACTTTNKTIAQYPGAFEDVKCSRDGRLVITGTGSGLVSFYSIRSQ